MALAVTWALCNSSLTPTQDSVPNIDFSWSELSSEQQASNKAIYCLHFQGQGVKNVTAWADGTNGALLGDIYCATAAAVPGPSGIDVYSFSEPLLRQNLTALGISVRFVVLDGSSGQMDIYNGPVSSWPILALSPNPSDLTTLAALSPASGGSIDLSTHYDCYSYAIGIALWLPTSGTTTIGGTVCKITNFRLMASFNTLAE